MSFVDYPLYLHGPPYHGAVNIIAEPLALTVPDYVPAVPDTEDKEQPMSAEPLAAVATVPWSDARKRMREAEKKMTAAYNEAMETKAVLNALFERKEESDYR